jgi:uncharacterized protein (TIGR03437 family)
MFNSNRIYGVALIGILLPALGWAQGYTASIVAGGGSLDSSGVPATQDLVVPIGVAVDSGGTLYLAEAIAFVSKVTPNGIITTIAGTAYDDNPGFSGDGGPAINAQFNFSGLFPAGVAVDSLGNIFIADTDNHRIRKIASNGIISTVAGGGSQITANYGDGGPATAAFLFMPTGVAVDTAENLYIADFSSVRKVDANGTITTVAGCTAANNVACLLTATSGSVGDGGPATSAYLQDLGVAVDRADNLYIADWGNNRIRKVANGIITTVAGSASGSYQGDGGPATSAGLNNPLGVAVDASGNIYIDDAGDYRIRMVTADGTINTIAGNGAQGQGGNTPINGGPATSISLGPTEGIALGPAATVYVADLNYGVWLLMPSGSPAGTLPSISSGGVVSASAFGAFSAVAPGSYIEIYGRNLAPDTRGWSSADFTGVNAPTSLDGTSVTIGGQPAYVAYISPEQVNVQAPSDIGPGSQALIVKTSAGASNTYQVTVNATEAGLLAPASFNIAGRQYVAALFQDGAFALPPGAIAGVNSRRAQPGDTLTLYGVGFGTVNPNIPAGQIAEGTSALSLPFHVNFGSTAASVSYAGLAPQLVGLYQFNVVVPNVATSDAVPLTFTLNGQEGTQTLYTSVQN